MYKNLTLLGPYTDVWSMLNTCFTSAICILSGTVLLSLVDLALTSVNSGFTGVSNALRLKGLSVMIGSRARVVTKTQMLYIIDCLQAPSGIKNPHLTTFTFEF